MKVRVGTLGVPYQDCVETGVTGPTGGDRRRKLVSVIPNTNLSLLTVVDRDYKRQCP